MPAHAPRGPLDVAYVRVCAECARPFHKGLRSPRFDAVEGGEDLRCGKHRPPNASRRLRSHPPRWIGSSPRPRRRPLRRSRGLLAFLRTACAQPWADDGLDEAAAPADHLTRDAEPPSGTGSAEGGPGGPGDRPGHPRQGGACPPAAPTCPTRILHQPRGTDRVGSQKALLFSRVGPLKYAVGAADALSATPARGSAPPLAGRGRRSITPRMAGLAAPLPVTGSGAAAMGR